jgi:hypothetical protein
VTPVFYVYMEGWQEFRSRRRAASAIIMLGGLLLVGIAVLAYYAAKADFWGLQIPGLSR